MCIHVCLWGGNDLMNAVSYRSHKRATDALELEFQGVWVTLCGLWEYYDIDNKVQYWKTFSVNMECDLLMQNSMQKLIRWWPILIKRRKGYFKIHAPTETYIQLFTYKTTFTRVKAEKSRDSTIWI